MLSQQLIPQYGPAVSQPHEGVSQVAPQPKVEVPEHFTLGQEQRDYVHQVLSDRFNHDSFRPMQELATTEFIVGKDVLLISPTGSGKSLCYFIPTIVGTWNGRCFDTNGFTVVISPLIALINDQLSRCKKLNIPACTLSGGVSKKECDRLFEQLMSGSMKIVFCTPEKLKNGEVFDKLYTASMDNKLKRIVIDECHCVTMWGHEFREDYSDIGKIRVRLSIDCQIPLMATTATLTPTATKEVIDVIFGPDTNLRVICSTFRRTNLSYKVYPKKEKKVLEVVKEFGEGQGIVYCMSCHEAEVCAKLLREGGVTSVHYHAQMKPKATRAAAQQAWVDGQAQVELLKNILSFSLAQNEVDKMNEVNETLVSEMDSSFYLGSVHKQDIVPATPYFLMLSVFSSIEGLIMVCGNLLLFSSIMAHKQLRRKEMYMISGLAMGDLIYGMGYIFAGFRLTGLGLEGKQFWLVSPWACMGALQNPFFILGSQAAGLMLVMISIDRLIAVRWFAYYMKLGARYGKVAVLTVYSYSCLSLVVIVLLSAFATPDDLRVVAICISTQVGPQWLSSYQPTVQMVCGVLSVLIYIATWYFYRKQAATMPQNVQNQQMKRQRKLTKIMGITVIFTLFSYVVPHSMIMIFNFFESLRPLATQMGTFVWLIGNINSFVNIFILGIHNNDIRRVLKAWIVCEKAHFAGGHAVSRISSTVNHSRNPNPTSSHRARRSLGQRGQDGGEQGERNNIRLHENRQT